MQKTGNDTNMHLTRWCQNSLANSISSQILLCVAGVCYPTRVHKIYVQVSFEQLCAWGGCTTQQGYVKHMCQYHSTVSLDTDY